MTGKRAMVSELFYVPVAEFRRVRNLPAPAEVRTSLFATLCRINTLYMIKRAGSGHIGTSFSCMDIVCWLFLNEITQLNGDGDRAPADIYFSSKGHDAPALYAVLAGLELLDFELIHKLRRLGGLPGHPDVSTPFVHTNTGSLGMGISKAKGMALANRLLGRSGHIYVLTGDGELQEGQIWESLQSAANQRLSEISVIVDHNKIQSDTWVSRTSDLMDLEKKFQAFGWHCARCSGHDYQGLSAELACLKAVTDRPKVIIADTVKGKGVSFMEHTSMEPGDKLYRFHSGAPDDDSYAKGVTELIARSNAQLEKAGAEKLSIERVTVADRKLLAQAQRLVSAYSTALVKQAEINPRMVVLDADLVLDCGLIPFKERFPGRFFECGIAEQDMVSQAGGMALSGLLPVVHSFACFLSARPNEQIYNNATERTKIIYVASLAGLLPGGPGHSHQSVRDISSLAAVPGLILIEPCNEAEVEMALDFCINHTPDSCYLRLVSVPVEVSYELPARYGLQLGSGVPLTDGRDAVLFSYGPVMLSQACEASKLLARRGIGLKVVNLPWLNRLDTAWFKQTVLDYRWIFTLDDHYVVGGQGDMLLSHLAELGLQAPPHAKKLGVLGIPVCGTNDEVLRAHRLDAGSLCQDIACAMEGGQ